MAKKSLEPAGKQKKSTGKSQEKGTGRASRSRNREEKPEVLSGRLVIALALFLGMSVLPASGLGRFIEKKSPRTASRASWKVGQSSRVLITVVTSDYSRMACADARSAGDAHCEFENEREKWKAKSPSDPVDNNKKSILQPYRTTDKNLILAAGFWAQPEVAMRAHREPARNVSRGKLARFVASCEVEFIAKWERPAIRWSPSQKWLREDAMVAEFKSCRLLEPGEQ